MSPTATTTKTTRNRKPPAELSEMDPHGQREAALRLRDEVQAEAARLTAAVAASPDALAGLYANARALVNRHWPGAESAKLTIQMPPLPGTIPIRLNYIHIPLTAPEPEHEPVPTLADDGPDDVQARRTKFLAWAWSIEGLLRRAAEAARSDPSSLGLDKREGEEFADTAEKALDGLVGEMPAHLHPDARTLPPAPWR